MSIEDLKHHNALRWAEMKPHNELIHTFDQVSARLCAAEAKAHYEPVWSVTTVPWFIIAVIHEREASQSWLANLAQGDPWNEVSRHVPKNQGPFKSWADAAINALKRTPPFAARWDDWTAGGALTLLEMYNGLGYHTRGLPSPYVWAGSSEYHCGKYIADGHFDPNAVDHQLGCAPLLMRMANIDKSVHF